jgi:hypothetical protein
MDSPRSAASVQNDQIGATSIVGQQLMIIAHIGGYLKSSADNAW